MRVLVNHLNSLSRTPDTNIEFGFYESIEIGETFLVVDFFEPETVAALTKLYELTDKQIEIGLLQDIAKSIPVPSVYCYRCLNCKEISEGRWIVQGDRLPRATLDKTL